MLHWAVDKPLSGHYLEAFFCRFVSNFRSLLSECDSRLFFVMVPRNSVFFYDGKRLGYFLVRSQVIGSTIMPLSDFFTLSISVACASRHGTMNYPYSPFLCNCNRKLRLCYLSIAALT